MSILPMHPVDQSHAVPQYSRSPLRSYHAWTPRFWHGMGLGAWLRLLSRNRFAVSPSRFPLAATITKCSLLNSFATVFDQLLFSHLVRRTELKVPPLFVLGHWRSGTTLLHELLILDPRHTYPNTYQCFEPQHFLWTEWFVPLLTKWLLPATRPMDNVQTGWDRPQEDEFALANLGLPSPYLCWAFPNHGPVDDDYLDLVSLSESDREHWKRVWSDFVRRIALVNNRRIVLKSPTHTARVKTILEVFPDAKFVHIVRNPLVIFPSTVRLWRSLSEVQGLQCMKDDVSWIESSVLDNFVRMYERFEKDRELVPADRLIDVRYEDLVRDPIGELKRVYEQLDLGDFERAEPGVRTFAFKKRDYRRNQYELPPEVAERIRRRWAPYFERYGYNEQVVESASA